MMLKSATSVLLGFCLAIGVHSQSCTSTVQFLPGFNSDLSLCMKPTTGTTLPHATPFTISWDFSSVATCTTYAKGFTSVPGLISLFFGYAPCKDGLFTPYSSQTIDKLTGSFVTSIGPCPICTSGIQQSSIDVYLAGNYNGTIYLLGGANVNLTYFDVSTTRPTIPTSPSNAVVVPQKPTTTMFTATFPTAVVNPAASPVGSATTTLSKKFIYTLNFINLFILLLHH